MDTDGAGRLSKSNNQDETSLAFLLDVDNTLLDNDRLKEDLDEAIEGLLGKTNAERFWQIYEEVRHERDFVDFPETIERMVAELGDPGLGRRLSNLILDWPFAPYVYTGAFEAIDHLKCFGTVAIVSDGDSRYQPLKIRRSGLEAAVDGNVLVYVHKEERLDDVFARIPADHYVAVDDKPRIILALEKLCPSEFTTIFVLQGKYAEDQRFSPEPDYVVDRIGDLRKFTRGDFLAPHTSKPTAI